MDYKGILCDAGYGELRPFLRHLQQRRTAYVAQVPGHHAFWPASVAIQQTRRAAKGRPRQYPEIVAGAHKPLAARQWASQIKKWHPFKVTLSSGLKCFQAQAIRVRPVYSSSAYYAAEPLHWLMIIKSPDGSLKYYVSNRPANTPLSSLVEWAQQRRKIEQGYQQLKQELGLDHFEGRSWRGLHHH